MLEPRRLTLVAVTVAVCALSGCNKLGGDSHAKVANDMVTQLKNVSNTLAGVTDTASADAATSKINDAAAEMDRIGQRMSKLPPVTKEEDDKIRDQVRPQIQEIQTQMTATRTRLAGKADVMLALQGPLMRLQQSMSTLGRPATAAK